MRNIQIGGESHCKYCGAMTYPNNSCVCTHEQKKLRDKIEHYENKLCDAQLEVEGFEKIIKIFKKELKQLEKELEDKNKVKPLSQEDLNKSFFKTGIKL